MSNVQCRQIHSVFTQTESTARQLQFWCKKTTTLISTETEKNIFSRPLMIDYKIVRNNTIILIHIYFFIGSRALSFSDPYIHFACLSVLPSVILSVILLVRERSALATLMFTLRVCLSFRHSVCPQLRS